MAILYEKIGNRVFIFIYELQFIGNFAVMVVVLSVPAPARMGWGPGLCLMAESWQGLG